MKIAILGGGFSGLATTWHLLQAFHNRMPDITIFDSCSIGMGTSGVSAGLLHPFIGAHSKLNREGREGYLATADLLDIASKALGTPVSERSGILRIALTEQQASDFRACANIHDDVKWCEPEACKKLAPGVAERPGIFINCGITVNSALYLQGLWTACEQKGVKWVKRNVNSLSDLNTFDHIIVAAGAHTKNLPELQDIPVNPIKGQILELSWPKNIPYPTAPLNSHVYILINKSSSSCIVGATFERNFNSELPDINIASDELLPKAYQLFPPLLNSRVLTCRAGIRASTPTHLPLVIQKTKQISIITGMGSKGLLYHSLTAKKLVTILQKDFNF